MRRVLQMKRLSMPDIECRSRKARGGPRIFIPGGWEAFIAEISLDAETLRAYTRVVGSAAEAAALHQQIYERGYIVGLRLAIARRAQLYYQLYPELAEPLRREYDTSQQFVTLRGFDPQTLQSTYIPFERPGRAGNPLIEEMLHTMAKEAKLAA